MGRKKTSRRQEFSFKNMPAFEIKSGGSSKHYNASDRLKDKQYVASALIQCLQEGDSEAFKEILRGHLDVINKSHFSKKTHIPERTLYRMVSEEGNPTLDNIARVVHALCA